MKYLISSEAQTLIDNGFVSNGCGVSSMPRILVYFLTHLFSFDLAEVCGIHDAEYSLSRSIKTKDRKISADINFMLNLERVLTKYPDQLSPKRQFLYKKISAYQALVDAVIKRIPPYFHSAVMIKGDKAYWL